MAGHSKWKNIQHRKGAQDAKRGKIFSKISKELSVAVRLAGDDPDSNARLRLALSKARAANMPKDNIERAIKKASGNSETDSYREKLYEAFAIAGSAFLVTCLTDNTNRTVSEVRHAFTKHGGNLGNEGSVSWMFKHIGVLSYLRQDLADVDTFIDQAVEHGADDIDDDDPEMITIICQRQQFIPLKKTLDTFNVVPQIETISYQANELIDLDDEKKEKINKLIDHLDDLEDVQEVYHNIKDC